MTETEMQQIMHSFCLLADLEEEEAQRYLAIVELAAGEMRARLKKGTDTAENSTRITLLCAANAYVKYALLRAGTDTGSIKLGDVSVSGGGECEAAAARDALEEFCAACADILTDRAFVFGQVKA
ncbi:MAG: hypothetical protein ACERKO_10680 [Acetanaerobacterium sp.]